MAMTSDQGANPISALGGGEIGAPGCCFSRETARPAEAPASGQTAAGTQPAVAFASATPSSEAPVSGQTAPGVQPARAVSAGRTNLEPPASGQTAADSRPKLAAAPAVRTQGPGPSASGPIASGMRASG